MMFRWPWLKWQVVAPLLNRIEDRISNAFLASDEARQLARRAVAEASHAAALARTVRAEGIEALRTTLAACEALHERVAALEAAPCCGTCGARFDSARKRRK